MNLRITAIMASSISSLMVAAMISAPAATAAYDPCSSAQELNSQGGNFGEFTTDEGAVGPNPSCPEPAPEPAQEQMDVLIEEPVMTPEPQPTETVIVEVPAPEETTEEAATPSPQPTPEVTQSENKKDKKKKKKDKKKKDKKKNNKDKSNSPSVTVIPPSQPSSPASPEPTPEPTTDNDVVTGIVVEETPTQEEIPVVQPAAVPAQQPFPWMHVYGTAAITLAAAALFVASRRRGKENEN